MPALGLWMNGEFVGRWEKSPQGTDRLVYARSWIESPAGRPLSLSLPLPPLTGDAEPQPLTGPPVVAWFENLIPDNDRILQRLQQRFGAPTTRAFDLLAAIGRDCAGALQLLPLDETPGDIRRIDAEPLDDAGVARVLRQATLPAMGTGARETAFRLSIAGAQEKTALLRHEGRWCIPHGATPTSHIFKLPLGLVGNMRADLSYSVELEWLCMEIARGFGLPSANVSIERFEDQVALVVERFDRRLAADGTYWLRLPQEDLCQATATPPARKYEADGGPGIARILDLLRASDNAEADRLVCFRAQLLFWMLAAIDGHAKNFSIALLPGGRYRLTPLYDILSAYPILGRGPGQLDPRDAKLAMAVQGRNRHYALHEIHRWHWSEMATRLGLAQGAGELIDQMTAGLPRVLDELAARLPAGFPAAVFDAVAQGLRDAAARLAREPDRRA